MTEPPVVPDVTQTAVEKIWTHLQPLLGSANYTGCMVQVAPLARGADPPVFPAGQVGLHQLRLTELAAEKIDRLRFKHESDGHLTSGQSRDAWKAKLGGAIIAGQTVIAVTALTEEADEALALCLALDLGLADIATANSIAVLGSNQLFPKLCTSLKL